MNEPLKEDPKVESIQQSSYKSLLVSKCIVEAFFENVQYCVKLVCDLVFLKTKLTPLLVVLDAHRVSGQPFYQTRFVHVVH